MIKILNMKIVMKKLILICLLVFFVIPLMAKDKPEVFVSFEIHPENNQVFMELIENNEDVFKNDANEIIITGLNEYIGFVNFSQNENNASQHLKIILTNKGSKLFPAYTLNFEMTGLNDSPITHPWQFVNQTEFMVFVESTDIIMALKSKWNAYLEDIGTQEMVSIFFDKIGFSLPDSEHYFINEPIKQAILPFRKDTLRIDYTRSEFLIETKIIQNPGDTLTIRRTGNGIGEVREGMINNENLLGCIRIELKDFDSLAPSNGQIYITLYQRISSQDIATPSDFMNSNNNLQ